MGGLKSITRYLNKRRQIWDVAISAIYPFDDDQGLVVPQPLGRQYLVQCLKTVVREGQALGARELAALHDAVVRESVVEHDVVRPAQVPDGIDIRGVA